MPLHQLKVYQFRNLRDVCIDFDTGMQFVFGDNASGKTSLLDAVHVLCSAKSFLGASPKKLQQYQTNGFAINGLVSQQDYKARPIQYRWQNDNIQLLVSHEQVRRTSEYANLQPVQAVTPLSYRLLDDSPGFRRRFIDWGVFHVKHEFADIWRRFQRNLMQRNAMLGEGVDRRTIAAWSEQYVRLANSLHRYRAEYIELLTPKVKDIFHALLPASELTLRYYQGWDSTRDLNEVLVENFQHDLDRRFTYYGPQRAELTLKLDGVVAKDSASRGQKKLITFALYLAQASLQQDIGAHSGIFLVDDLPGELDRHHIATVMNILREIPMQIFISCIDVSQLPKPHRRADKMFHMKHGSAEEVVK